MTSAAGGEALPDGRGAAGLRVRVDARVCIGSRQCELFCPEVFEVKKVAAVKVAEPEEALHQAVRDAADSCPVQAISVDE